jgi:hypothetical protein
MADVKPGEPFGLDDKLSAAADWDLAIQRIRQDQKTDFIYAPHLSFLYAHAGKELIAQVRSELKSGKFNPGLPLTMEVPKSFRIPVNVASKRLGPSYSRPGSILMPKDRLLYQVFADQAAPVIDAKTDHARSFSHKLAPGKNASMFLPTRTCWNELQKSMQAYAAKKEVAYVLKLDVANFFGSLNQHTLINVLRDSGYDGSLASRLEAMLSRFTGERNSRGIVQGIMPSDLFGNFYLAPVDRFLADNGVISARYVDDLYIFVPSVDAAEKVFRGIIPLLRGYDLNLNEAKSRIIPKGSLATEEPDLQVLFDDAVSEIASQIDDEDMDVDYGFQSEWGEEESDQPDLELEATTKLFDSIASYPGQEENIERFCLPLFAKAGSDYAVDLVIEAFRRRPSMSQIYTSYLANFVKAEIVYEFLAGLLSDETLMDWQKMWVLAALARKGSAPDAVVKAIFDLLKDANRHEALRAVAAIFVGRFGDHGRRKSLSTLYPAVPPYVQAAMYYASRWWPAAEKATAKASWSGHSELHGLFTAALTNSKAT